MPRTARVYLPGVPVHIIQRGNDRAALFHEPFDFECFHSCTMLAMQRHGVAVHAYVLMTNHVHVLATPSTRESLGKAMHWSGFVFVQQINKRYDRTGSRFESRYKTRFIEDEAHFLSCMRYIEENPVRAGMVASPVHYRWSSFHANALGLEDGLVTPHPIFQRLGPTSEDRATHYRALFSTPFSLTEVQAVRVAPLARGRRPRKGTGPVMGTVPIQAL